MDIIIIGIVAALASLLTFFSGFGLGTLLTPTLILFFPIEIAIALSGIVHLLNNVFKMILVGKYVNWQVALKFGLPAIVGAFLGAKLLQNLPDTTVLYSYVLGSKICQITPLKLIMAGLMIFFALFELIPYLKKLEFKEDKLYFGGLISGFFGGLSGNQGALRSAFLIRTGLSKEVFIATGFMIACFIDVTRLGVYFNRLSKINIAQNSLLLIVAVLCAFAGAYLGSKALKKVTLHFVQNAVTIMIFLLAIALGLGLI
jgi:uncharacterized protein